MALTVEPPAARRIEGRTGDPVTPILFGTLAVVAGIYLIWKTRGNAFFYDEWTWLFTRRSGLGSIVSSYNSQMVLVPSAVYSLLWHTIGLRHYWVFRAIGVAVHLGLVATVFTYARRRVAEVALAFAVPLLFLGYGWEDVIWPINFGFVAALALSILALISLDGPRPRRDGLACLALVAALACSEIALVFALGLAVELSWRDRGLRRCWVWLVPFVLYGCWWVAYFEPSGSGSGLTEMPSFAASMAAAAIGGLLGLDMTWGKTLIVLAAVGAIARFARPRVFSPRAACVVVAAIAYWLLVAYGRNAHPDSARYIYTGAVLLTLVAAEALRGVRVPRLGLALGGVVALLALLGNLHQMAGGERDLRYVSHVSRAELGALDIAQRLAPSALLIDSQYMPGMTAGQYFATVRALRSTPADPPGAISAEGQAAAGAADSLLVRAGDLTASLPRSGSVGAFHSCAATRAAGRVLSLAPGHRLLLRGSPGADVQIYARRFASGFGATRLAPLTGGQTLLVRAADDGSARPWSLEIQGAGTQRASVCV